MTPRTFRPLLAHFADLDDPRVARTRKHNLLDILAVALCAVVCGADSWADVEAYGKAKQPWLTTFLALPNGIPSHDTFGRVFAALDPDRFAACFSAWMAELAGRLGLKQVAIDGKALRGSHDRAGGKAALHLVSAWACENGLVLGQEAVDAKSNEITAIPRLLELLDLDGALVSIDAAGCQVAIAEEIVAHGGDYLLAVKANQPTLYADIDRLAEAALADDAGLQTRFEQGRGHGRAEARACWVLDELGGLTDRGRWPGLKSVVVVVSERAAAGGEPAYERRYYISSRAASAKAFLGAVRSHWGIENGLHWVLDVGFDEDGSRVRKDHGPANLGLLRRLGLTVLKQAEGNQSLRGKRLTAGWDNGFLEKALHGFNQI